MAWSFRGNGALVVPFGVGPAMLAGGWTALVLHGRISLRWLWWSIAAGLTGVAVVLASVAATIFGRLDIADRITYAMLTWTQSLRFWRSFFNGAQPRRVECATS